MSLEQIDLNNIDELNAKSDDESKDFWQRIRTRDFAFGSFNQSIIHKIEENDILLHKKFDFGLTGKSKTGKQLPPRVIYYVYVDKMLLQIPYETKSKNAIENEITDEDTSDNYDVKTILKKQLLKYIVNNSMYPYACSYFTGRKNGDIIIHYNPDDYTTIPFKIVKDDDIEWGETIEEFQNNMKSIQMLTHNEIGNYEYKEHKKEIEPMSSFVYIDDIRYGFIDKGNIYVSNAKVDKLEKRHESFNLPNGERVENNYFICRIMDFDASPDNNVSNNVRVPSANLRLSEKLVDKTKISIGDNVTFKGILDLSNKGNRGALIMNIRNIIKN